MICTLGPNVVKETPPTTFGMNDWVHQPCFRMFLEKKVIFPRLYTSHLLCCIADDQELGTRDQANASSVVKLTRFL